MHDEAAFLRTIAAAPDDDAPRLVYADWLEERGDPRGTFVRVQCALAALPADDPRRSDLEHAERRLLATHAADWTCDLAGRVSGWRFRRGFVEEVTLSAASFLEFGADLLRPGLVRTVRLTDCGDAVPALAGCPLLARVAHLDLGVNYLGDDGLAGLVRSEHVRGLRGLALNFNGLSPVGVQALLDAGPWPNLMSLDLQGNFHIPGRAARLIAQSRSLPALEALDLRDNHVDAAGTWMLANSKTLPRLADLALAGNPLGDGGARALAQSPLLPRQLTRTGTLDLRDTGLGPAGVQALVAGDHLRPVVVLNFAHNHVGDAGVTALSVADLPRLRELDLAGNGVTDEGAAALAGAPFLGRLTALGLADNRLSPAGHVALMSSPYWHWKTVIDLTDNRPPEPDADGIGGSDDAPIPLDYERE